MYEVGQIIFLVAKKAQSILGWKPKITFDELVNEMMDHDLKSAKLKKQNIG